MALSQIQCLDDNNVNLRTHESKPEFLYCEDQRVALEALLRNGRDAFFKCLEARGLRGFLSDPELETLVGTVEPYDPDSEIFPENAEEDEPALSLHYWPELSDMSIPQMDMGWPDSESYRGVTRTTVYSQPPLEGQAHIKEVVRKMIAQAQKVIAVVMDVFTDVDIFRDLLDAGFKRRVSVYILLERSSLPHFLSMCRRHLRVRCTDGAEFYSRSSTKVRGQMGHRFMFVDGDKALSGSYRFTWMSSRLDKNLVTVITGQAVEAFDRLYRILYSTSSFVNLQQVATEPEPEPEPIPQPVAAPLPSAALARKLHNPKYALVNLGNPARNNSPQEAPKTENSKGPEEINQKGRRKSIKEAPPLHPGLANLEKVCMMAYLPTWPDPDPPKDVIGYINIRDSRKPTQVHLQRSEIETKSLSRTAKVSSPSSSSSSSSLEKAVKKEGEESKDVEKKRGAEGTEGDSPGRERTGSKVKESKGTVEKNKEAPSQAPKKQKVLNQSAVERPVDGGGTPGTNDGVEPKRLSTGDSTPKTVCTEREAPDKEKKPLGPSVVARREKPQTTKETEGKKV
uniref:Family with sequence similarity 83 member G n=1 Tax=Labrus bergylta TaxID=56723 RepID=A0A3Q3E7Q5_9LABR